MKYFSSGVVLLLPLLAACGGGGASTSSVLPQTAQTAALQQTPLAPVLLSSGANDLLYIGNTGNNSITVYNHAAQGNTRPLRVIAGSRTGISSPGQLSADAQGNLYVANGSSQGQSTNPGILIFAHGANGNVAPIRKIAGSLTGINNVEAMIVDKVTGNIFVADNGVGLGDDSTLMIFPPNATGNTAPFARVVTRSHATRSTDATSGTIMFWALQLAFNSTNQNLIVAHPPACCTSPSAGVETYSKNFQNNTILNTLYSINSFWPNGVADDPTTKTYLASSNRDGNVGLYRFAEDSTGYGAGNYGGLPADFTPPVVSIITSETCGTQLAVAPGRTPYTYVMHGTQTGCPTNAVYVYANNASGNATPVRILSGSATKMNRPYGIYEGP
jgi:hypothetical protein